MWQDPNATSSRKASAVDLTTGDAVRLREIFAELAKRKDDSQQRSWFLHEDEHIIAGTYAACRNVIAGTPRVVTSLLIRCSW